MNALRIDRERFEFLLQEAALFLVLSYLVLEGGVSNGLVSFRLNRASFWLVTILAAVWLVWRFRRRRPFPATALDAAWLALLASYLISTVASTDPRRSAVVLVQLILAGLAFYLAVDLLRAGWPASLLTRVIVLTSILPILLSFVQLGIWYAGWIKIVGWGQLIPPVSYRVSAFIANPNFSAAYFNVLLPFSLVGMVRNRKRSARIAWLIFYILARFMIFMSSSRGGWLATLAILGVFLLLLGLERREEIRVWWRAGRGRARVIALAATAMLAELALTGLFFAWQTRSTGSAGTGLEASARSGIWAVALDAFRAHPILGNGPFTFGTEYVRQVSVPPSMLLAYAHNHLFNVAAENGLVGVLALAFMLGSLAWLLHRRWRAARRDERLMLSGIIACLAGLAVHSQFDTPVLLPAIGILAMLLIAIPAAKEAVRPRRVPGWLPKATLAAGVGLTCVALGWNVWGYSAAIRGVEASTQDDWLEAARWLDEAVRRDPYLAFNWLQAGYAHGRLALAADGSVADAGELEAALAAYRRGVTLEPAYGVNWANYGVLQWAAGDRAGAIAALQTAADRLHQIPAFRLTLGRMLEAAGREGEALDAYRRVLDADSEWAGSAFFRATPLRRQALAAWQAVTPAPTDDWARFSEAELQSIRFSYPGGWMELHAQLALGRIYSQRGEAKAAISAYEEALMILERTTSYGIGTLGGSPYGWMAFNRESIEPDLLPGIDYLLYTDNVVAGMLDLAGNYEKVGDGPAAAWIRASVDQVTQAESGR